MGGGRLRGVVRLFYLFFSLVDINATDSAVIATKLT